MEKQWEACCTNLILLDGKKIEEKNLAEFLKTRTKEQKEGEEEGGRSTTPGYSAPLHR